MKEINKAADVSDVSAQLVQQQKLEALGLFAGGIAHDFNNILSIIEGYTHIAMRQLKEGTLTAEQLKKILTSTQRGAGLTRQLLAFGRQKIDLEEKINLADVLKQQHILLKPLVGEMIKIYMTLPEDDVWIQASSDQITQIIMNIAINARDAMPDGGELGIMCYRCLKQNVPMVLRTQEAQDSFVKISLMDSGTGIHSDVLPRIFDPFFTTKGPSRGTGLGLSVVHGIVGQLRGHIEVTSKRGEGTAFDIYIPVTIPPVGVVPEIQKHNYSQSIEGKTILVAEDEPELRDVLVTILGDMKMKVLSASNGNQALLVQEEYGGDIDFLLTDVVMPEMNGVRLGELFQSLRPSSEVVYMSGYPFIEDKPSLKVPDDAPFISKPLQEEKIRQVLERALQRRDERAERMEEGYAH